MPSGRLLTRVRPGRRAAARALLGACHPEPAALVTLLTTALALRAGAGAAVLWIAPAVAAGQLSVGWSNDYLDRGRDRAAGRPDKPLAATDAIRPATVRNAALLALAAALPLSLAVSPGFAAAHLGAVACALAYNAGLKATPLSVLPYAVAFGLLPAAVALALPTAHWPPLWAVAAGVFTGAGGHFTQALPDIPIDRRQGIRGLPQMAGPSASGAAAAALLLAGNLAVAFGARESTPLFLAHLAAALGLTAAILTATAAGRGRLAFRITLASASLAVLAFVAAGSRL